MLLLGSAVWAYVICSGCGVLATLQPRKLEYRQTMDELNYFCRAERIPPSLAVRLRAYTQNTQHLLRSRR